MKKINISLNIYLGIAITFIISAIVFMTNYYQLFVFGSTVEYNVYLELQELNKEIFYAAVLVIIIVFILRVLDVGKPISGKPALIGTWINSVVNTATIGFVIASTLAVRAEYNRLDFAGMTNDYVPSNLGFDAVILIAALVIVCSYVLSILTTIELKKKKEIK